ncbi:MAG: AtpZ/AtpI family protein [Patescibacteria group bacterium]
MNDRQYYLFGLRIAGDFGLTIAIPVVLLVLLGRSLDERYQQGWLFTVLAFILAALISGTIIYRKAKKYGQEYQKLDEKK